MPRPCPFSCLFGAGAALNLFNIRHWAQQRVDENERLKRELRAATIASGARIEAVKAGVPTARLDDAVTVALNRLDLSENERLVVLDEAGGRSAMSVEHFFGTVLRRDREWLFEDDNASRGVTSLKDLRTAAQKSAFIRQHDLEAFKALPRD